MSTIAKPELRGILGRQIKKNLIGMVVFTAACAMLYKGLITDPRKRKYNEFYKTYDAEKQLKIMNEAGLMQSYITEEK